MVNAREHAIAFGNDPGAVTESAVCDECVSGRSQFYALTAAQGQIVEPASALDEVDSLGAFAVAAIKLTRKRWIDRRSQRNLRQRFTGPPRQHKPKRLVRDAIHHGIGAAHRRNRDYAQLVVRPA